MKLVLVGPSDGNADAIRETIRALGLESCVEITGQLPHEEAMNVLRNFDVALSYDTSEWLPSLVAVHSKVFEYLAAGLPIVATRHPAHEEVLQADFNAILTAPDPEAFAGGIERVVSDQQLRERLAKNALRSSRLHDVGAKASRVAGVYKLTLAQRDP